MKFTDIFIRRPVLAIVVNLFILLAGFQAIAKLNVREYPKVQNAVVTVTVAYPGAPADLIAGFITTPLEREIASADGIDFVESSSTQSLSTITARLRLNYDPNDALTQITAKVNRVRGELPAAAEDPVIDVSVGETTAAMYISFFSPTLDGNQITDYLTRVVQPKLSTVQGVQKAEILGARTFAMRIWLKPEKLNAYGISAAELRGILQAQNYLSAVGKTKGSLISINLNARTDLSTPEEFEKIIIKQEGERIVRLGDVADIVLGAESYDSSVKVGSRNATFMGIYALPTANVIDVVKRVREIYPDIVSQLPSGLSSAIPYDSTKYINDSIKEVVKTLIEAILIVIVVIYLFLGSFRSVLIPIIAIPISLIGGVFLMMLMGFTINLLTLLAMVMAIGIVVDDAIVVLENIHRHIEEGMAPLEASLKGAAELLGPVITMTLTLVAVFAPIGLQGGLTGQLFSEFVFTLAGAVLMSGVVAITLSPMMCGYILKPHTQASSFAQKVDSIFSVLKANYLKALHTTLEQRRSVYAIAGIMLLAIPLLYSCSKAELAPTEDRGFMLSVAQAAPTATIEQTSLYTDRLIKAIESYTESQYVFSIIGGFGGANSAFIGNVLKPAGERHRSSMQLLPSLQQELAQIPGISGGLFIPPALPGAGRGLPVQYVVCSTDSPERVAAIAQELLHRAVATGKFYFGDTDLKFDQPRTDIIIDRDKAAAVGINMSQIGADLGSMLGGAYANRFAIDGRSYKVIPQVTRVQRLNTDQLDQYYISNADGKLLPLSSVAELRQSVQPREIKRFQQLNAATISLLPAQGVSMSQALEILNREAKAIFPQGYTADYNNELRQFVQESGGLVVTFLLSVIVIYLLLAAQYESFRDPLIILISVPLAVCGALVFTYLGFTSINIYTQVGIITLVGIISKNGILIVEFANELRRQGRTLREAVEEAAATRLRPILMTTFSTVCGVLPLLFASGPGGVSRFSIGLIIATGMTIGTFFTLFVIPAFYILISKKDTPTQA
jgi:multidrug efflux pump